MSQHEVLNKEKHRGLRIKTGYSAALGDAVMYVMTYPMEFRDVQSCYPILFTKDPNTGGFFAAAILGFETDQNLFLQENGWDASYVPAMVQRQPFLIAKRADNDDRP
ncbi:MAG: SapC family protein, partial [Woeseiaceae bacterium]